MNKEAEKKAAMGFEDVEKMDTAEEPRKKEAKASTETKPDKEKEASQKSAEEAPDGETGDAKDEGTQGNPSEGEKAELSQEEEALQTKYMRLMADFQNYKRRAEKEKGDIYAYANEKLVVELLNVIDNFERALGQENDNQGYAEGMNMIFKQFVGVLEKAGLKEIEALGEDFDPNFHNAVMTEDNPDYESGKVTEVMQKGYSLNTKVIRPAMVKVNN